MKSSPASAGGRGGTGEIGSLTQLNLRHNLPAPQSHLSRRRPGGLAASRVEIICDWLFSHPRLHSGDKSAGAHPPSGGRRTFFRCGRKRPPFGLKTRANSKALFRRAASPGRRFRAGRLLQRKYNEKRSHRALRNRTPVAVRHAAAWK